jgi:hypothetical protein
MPQLQDTQEREEEGRKDKRRRKESGRGHEPLQRTALMVMGSHVRGHERKFRA